MVIPITAVVIIALAVISYHESSTAIMTGQKDHMQQMVQKTTDMLGLWLDDREREVAVLSKDRLFIDACKGLRLEEAQERLTEYQKLSPVYEALLLIHKNGVIFMASHRLTVGMNLESHPVYGINIKKTQEKQTWVGDVGKSPATGRPVMFLSAPITENGENRFSGDYARIVRGINATLDAHRCGIGRKTQHTGRCGKIRGRVCRNSYRRQQYAGCGSRSPEHDCRLY